MRREKVSQWEASLYPSPWEQAGMDHPHLARAHSPWVYWDQIVALGKGFGKVNRIADLSCGDGYITDQVAAFSGVVPIKGDFAPRYPIQGQLHDTIHDVDPVDLWIYSNTAEHVDDPERDLRLIREKARFMLFSAPLDEFVEPSGGHVWAWDREAVESMLNNCGWNVAAFVRVEQPIWNPHCDHGVWACE